MDAPEPRPALRAVLLGAGLMGRFHAAALARAGGTLVAVADPCLERGRRFARRAEFVKSIDELSSHAGRIDVVHVCTPLATHAELVGKALALGAHVLVEKPLTPDLSTTAALFTTAAERKRMLVPVHQFLFQSGVRRVLSLLPDFGPLVRCVFETTTAGADRTDLDPDRLVQEILPHPLSLFSHLAPHGLADLSWIVIRPAPGELRALAHSCGTTFEIVISTRGRPTRAGLEIIGTEGSARADLFHGFAVVERGGTGRARKVARPFTLSGATLLRAGANLAGRAGRGETAYPGLRELVRRTYDAVERGSPPPIGAQETLAVAAASDTILGS